MKPHVLPLLVVVVLSLTGSSVAAPRKKKDEDKKDTWTSLGLAGGGAMYTPAISAADPDRMMVNCDMSAAYVSHDGGRNWRMIHYAQLGGNTRCRPGWHPTDKDIVYAADGWEGRLKVSRDGGITFSEIGNVQGLRGEIHLCPRNPRLMFAGTADSLLRSENAGESWQPVDGPRGELRSVVSGHSGQAHLVWVATGQGIWRSADDGRTWTECEKGLPSREVRSLAGSTSPPDARKPRKAVLYCAVASRDDGGYVGGVFRSDDEGESWSSVMNGAINRDVKARDQWAHGDVAQYHAVLCTDVNPDIVWAFNANTGVLPPYHTAAWRSTDGGKSWTAAFYPDPRFAGYNVEPDYTTQGDGQFYQNIPDGVAICPSNPDVVVQVDSGCCIITRDGGKSWFNGHARAAGQKGCFENTGLVVTSTWHYCFDPHQPNRHYICYTDIGFARSLDAGKTWHWWAKNEKAPWRNTCYELAFDPETPGRLWGAFSNVHDIPNDNIISGRHRADGPGGVCISENFGETWTACKGLPEAPATSLVLAQLPPRDGGRKAKTVPTLVVGVFGHGVFLSTDGGKTWTAAKEQPGSAANRRVCRVQVTSTGTIYALVTALRKDNAWDETGTGLWRSEDVGATWTRLGAEKPWRWPKDFTLNPDNADDLLVSCADAGGEQQGGLWQSRDGGKSWKLLLRKGPQHFSAAHSPHHKGWIYATLCEGAPEAGLWQSKDGGKSWKAFDELPFRNIQRVEFDPKDAEVVYLTTFGGSVWRGPAEPR